MIPSLDTATREGVHNKDWKGDKQAEEEKEMAGNTGEEEPTETRADEGKSSILLKAVELYCLFASILNKLFLKKELYILA